MIVVVTDPASEEIPPTPRERFRASGTRRECENQYMNWMKEWIDYPSEKRADCLQYADVCAETFGWEVTYERER